MADDTEGYEGVKVAGLAVVAKDTGRVFLAQRTLDESDADDVKETYEFPGGHLEADEAPMEGAAREFAEEVGFAPPDGEVTGGWRSDDGVYQGFVWKIPYEFNIAGWKPTDEVKAVGWFDQEAIDKLGPELRPEVRDQMDWSILFEDEDLTAAGWCAPSGETVLADAEPEDDDFDEDDFDEDDLAGYGDKIPFHGSLVAFDVVADGRPVYPAEGTLRFGEPNLPVQFRGPDGETAAGVITRFEREDEHLLYEGHLDADASEDVVDLLAAFGRLGIEPITDDIREVRVQEETGLSIHADARIIGATIIADGGDFDETYLALGPLEDGEALTAARGPGWATHPRETSRLHRYWTKGKGAAKIRWNTPGDFYRCRRLVGAKIAKNSPSKVGFINRICAQWHKDATGLWTGDRRNPGNRRGSAEAITAALNPEGVGALPAEWFAEPEQPEMTFTYDEATGMTRVSGMVAEWRRCHLGYSNRCVTPPKGDGKYRLFLKGNIETSAGNQRVGVLTYGTGHAGLKQSLAEAAAHYDNTGRVWAFVNVGENKQGIWFSGVVNPELSEQTIWALKAGGAVSGDWRGYEGRSELISVLSVNVPGFPQPLVAAAFDENEEMTALTAAGIVLPGDHRIDQLRALAEAELRRDRIDHYRAMAQEAL